MFKSLSEKFRKKNDESLIQEIFTLLQKRPYSTKEISELLSIPIEQI